MAPRYPVVRVTAAAYNRIQDWEQACWTMAAASPDSLPEVEAAYSLLNLHRKDLYEYVAHLEAQLGLVARVTMRFD